MSRWLSLLVLWCCVQPLMAQSLVVLSEDLKAAWYAPSASSAAIPVDRVVRLTTLSGPQPPQPPTPGSTLRDLSAAWRTKVSPYSKLDQHRQALEGMYQLLSEQIAAGRFQSLKQLTDLTAELRNILLGTDRTRWDTWGRDVADEVVSSVGSLDDAALAYLEIALGLADGRDNALSEPEFLVMLVESSLSSEDALSPELRELIMFLIRILLARFFPGGT